MDISEVDFTKPVLTFDEMLILTKWAPSTLRKRSSGPPLNKVCQRVSGGEFLYHRDAFVSWLASGQDFTDEGDTETGS